VLNSELPGQVSAMASGQPIDCTTIPAVSTSLYFNRALKEEAINMTGLELICDMNG